MKPIGALRLWHEELRAGVRTPYVFDALWAAASREAQAQDFDQIGAKGVADSCRREAAEILLRSEKLRHAA
jgi:hypothetical protein